MTDATALAAAIADGRTSACAVMEATLAACETQADLGAVVYCDTGLARALARAADATPTEQRGPFHGVPFLAKDLGAVAARLPVAAGSAALRAKAARPAIDSHLFQAFAKAGLLTFGVTATPPFGLALSSAPEDRPEARNPWNPDLTPGGSSGGAAAAVASGLVSIAHATDAAGSIRVPAACCGLVGLKPSRGAIPGGPDYGNHLMGLASELVLARSVRDVRSVFERAHLPLPPVAQPAPARIALALPDRCDATQLSAVEAAADALSDAGCHIIEISAPDTLGQEAHDIARRILSVSLAEWMAALEICDDALPALAASVAAEGRATTAPQLFASSRQMASLSERAHRALFAGADAVLMPVLSSSPPPVGAQEVTDCDPDAHFARMERFAPNAALANVAGFCAIALPFGLADHLPLGVQLLGPAGSDFNLCRLAAEIEARAPAFAFPGPIAGLPT
ncbi:amidase [Phaeobacter sp. B1627]|uniref:amidase n=1 Tax=Phaeobacter sp. B1627 TaxID=2583809 RepID=UPI00111A00C2|nr:amidase [Phaeobacter sp. B1627]TNJ48399.1 amidase [Phaeobacter sp. B1627]